MPFVERKGQPQLHYVVDDFTDPRTNAPVVLLQHGNGRSAKFWYQWVPALARHYRVVRPDMRGLGESGHDFDLASELGCCRFQGHFVKVFNETGGVLWLREGDSAGNSSLKRSSW